MRIAIFSDTFPPQVNGVANTVNESAKALANQGHQVSVFTISNNSKKLLNDKKNNLAIVVLPSLPALVYQNERFGLPSWAHLDRLKKFNPDIVHIHTPFMVGWQGIWWAKKLKVPVVGTHHTFYDHYLKHIKMDYNWTKKFSWKYTVAYYNHCDLVLSPSRSLAEELTAHGLKKPIEIIQNPIDTNLFRPATDIAEKAKAKKSFGVNGQAVVYMGRLSYEKSVDQVVKAFALMLEKLPDLKLMLIGDGPEKNNLEKLSKTLGLKNKVIFTGVLRGENLVKALWANDIFITASKTENLPVSVLESMAAGLPIIAVKEKGLAEIIKENTNGFFVQTDNPKDISARTVFLLSRPE
ncbi:glycosyltransferase, partial [Patescibacteria group bacterium]|nr:glycosyltransferase [Patescibacteria group bacterium]